MNNNNDLQQGHMGGDGLWYAPQGDWSGGYAPTHQGHSAPNPAGPAYAMGHEPEEGEGGWGQEAAGWGGGQASDWVPHYYDQEPPMNTGPSWGEQQGWEQGQATATEVDVEERARWVSDGRMLPGGLAVSIISYNILSDCTSQPEYFPGVEAAHLDNADRLRKLKAKIDKHIRPIHPVKQETVWLGPERPIFCLQEVSTKQARELEAHFKRHRYKFICAHYGQANGGIQSMGVAIAYPTDLYWELSVREKRVSDAKWWNDSLSWSSGSAWYKDAQERQNLVLGVQLEPIDWHPAVQDHPRLTRFLVATYHMPCAYETPPVMTLHTSLVMQVVHEWAEGYDYILAGDFNFTPDQPAYELITSGAYPEPDAEGYADLSSLGDNWVHDNSSMWMNSAYSTGHPRSIEPKVTCVGYDDAKEFRGTLDYIFVKRDVRVYCLLDVDVDPGHKLPNATEPSDHVLLRAGLILPFEKCQ